jgi:hypothetical protein
MLAPGAGDLGVISEIGISAGRCRDQQCARQEHGRRGEGEQKTSDG